MTYLDFSFCIFSKFYDLFWNSCLFYKNQKNERITCYLTSTHILLFFKRKKKPN